MPKKTFREKQMEFGPYYFGGSGGGETPAPSSGNPNAPSLDVSQAAGPVSAGVQGAKAALNATSLNTALSGLTGAKGLASTIQGMGLRGATSMVPGLNALQGLTALFSGPLGFLSGVLGKYGLQGQDTSGLASDAALAAMNQGGPISNAAFATLTQGLGLTPAQLDAISQRAPFGRGLSPLDAPPPTLDLTEANLVDALGGPPTGPTGPTGGDLSDTGLGGGVDFHKGAVSPKVPPRALSASQHSLRASTSSSRRRTR